jgi:hypothetical protein
MTNLAGQEGHVTVAWIAETFGEAHRGAIDWPNANTDDGFNFFAAEVQAWKTGASAPAPRFNIVAKPNIRSRGIARVMQPDSKSQSQYAAYWAAFGAFPRGADCAYPGSRTAADYVVLELPAWPARRFAACFCGEGRQPRRCRTESHRQNNVERSGRINPSLTGSASV